MTDKILFVEICRRLTRIYGALAEANKSFVAETWQAERVQTFLDQRDFSLEEVLDLEEELRGKCADLFPGSADPGLKNIFEYLVQTDEDAQKTVRAFRTALEELVRTEKQVLAKLEKERNELSEALKKVRRGSSLIRGYAPSDPISSCFIDKLK